MGTIRGRSISVSCTELPSPLVWLERYLTGKAADDFGDATQALQDRVTGGGVGNPDVPLAGLTEGAPRCDRDRSLFQNPLAQGRAVDRCIDAREHVERPVRTERGETVDLRELLEDQVAARPELLHHGLERGRRSAARRDARLR